MTRGQRWLRLGLASVGAILMVAIILPLLIINTQYGRVKALRTALEAIPLGETRVEIGDVKTSGLGDWSLDTIKIFQRGQLFLELHQVQLRWRPKLVLQQQLDIVELTAARLDWHKLPPDPNPTPKNKPKLWPIKVDKLAVQQWVWQGFERPIPVYQFEGKGSWLWQGTLLTLDADLRPTGSEQPLLTITTETSNGNQWQLKGNLREEAGGVIGEQLHLPKQQKLDAHFGLVIENLDGGYNIQVEALEMPWADHKLTAAGTLRSVPPLDNITINQLQLKIDNRSQVIRGHYNPQDLWLELQLDQFPVELIQPWLAVPAGTASGDFTLTWPQHNADHPWPDLKANGQLHTRWQDMPLNISLEGELVDRLLRFSRLNASLADTSLEAQGQFDLKGENTDFTFNLKNMTSEKLDRLELPFMARPGVVASALHRSKLALGTAQGRFKGPWQNPDVSVKTDIIGTFDDLTIRLKVDGDGNVRRAKFRQLNLTLPTASVNLQGELDWSGSQNNFAAQFSNIDSALFARFGVLLPQMALDLDGTAKVTGSLKQPKVALDATASGAYLTPKKDLAFNVNALGKFTWGKGKLLSLDAERLTLSLDNIPTAEVSGVYSPERMGLNVKISQLSADVLSTLGAPLLPGETAADVHISGSFAQPELSGHLTYSDNLKHSDGSSTPLHWRGELATAGRQLRLDSTFTEADHTLGKLQVQLPLDEYLHSGQESESTLLNLDIQAQGDLSLTKFLIDPRLYPMSGQIDLALKARGALTAPQLDGKIELKDGQFANQLLGLQLRKINLDLQASQQEVRISKATAADADDGKAELRGRFSWQNPLAKDAVQLSLDLDRMHLLERHDISAEGRGKVQLKGNIEHLLLSGEVILAPLNLSVESRAGSTIPQIEVTEYNRRGEITSAARGFQWPMVELDLWLKTGKQAFLRGRGLDAELDGGMLLQGPIRQLRYSGSVTSPKGRLELFGKRFILQRGEVTFDQGAINLYIPAIYTKNDVEIKAELSGSLNDLKLTLSSVPALPQDEILASLIFGKRVQDMTPFEALRLAAALQSMRGGAGFNVVDSARDLLGVDSLTIGTENTADGQTGVNLGVGKYVSERVYLEVQRSPNPSSPWQGDVQIELTPSINLESSTGDNGRGKAQLLWRHDY